MTEGEVVWKLLLRSLLFACLCLHSFILVTVNLQSHMLIWKCKYTIILQKFVLKVIFSCTHMWLYSHLSLKANVSLLFPLYIYIAVTWWMEHKFQKYWSVWKLSHMQPCRMLPCGVLPVWIPASQDLLSVVILLRVVLLLLSTNSLCSAWQDSYLRDEVLRQGILYSESHWLRWRSNVSK